MRLTDYSDYALRTLIYLALDSNRNTLATISEISNIYKISRSHLTKVIHKLAQIGYIESKRGKNGGIRLAKEPKLIKLGEVMRHTEPDFNIASCFIDSNITNLINDKDDQDDQDDQDENNIPNNLPACQDASKTKLKCVLTPVCKLKHVYFEANQAFLQVMDSYTLEDVIENKEDIWDVLNLKLNH